ncbi:MAG: RNA 2',3'-cyclic phosphodiesterase [Thiobacillus sp.]|nr:RNA 2',3'-cyclic phosphodiesterase [Thiobacillus sp.]
MADTAPPQAETLRLFFALWPDDATRDALDRVGKCLHPHWGGRRMRADTLHLTLAFLGSLPAESCAALLPRIDVLRAAAFELVLDRAGFWPHNHIGWLGCRDASLPLAALAERLRGELREAGVPFDAQPFLPHVTLLRNATGGRAPSCTPVRWRATDFALIASRTGVDGAHYDVLRRWPLI